MANPPIVVSPNKPLIDMKNALMESAKAITDFLEEQPDELEHKWDEIRGIRNDLNTKALELAEIIMENVEASLRSALAELKGHIEDGTEALRTIKKLNLMVDIATAILAAAVGVATGGVVAGIPKIISLGETVGQAIAEAEEENASDG